MFLDPVRGESDLLTVFKVGESSTPTGESSTLMTVLLGNKFGTSFFRPTVV